MSKNTGTFENEALILQQEISLIQIQLLKPALLTDKLKMITDNIVRLFKADFCRIWLMRPGDLCEDCVHANTNEDKHICRNKKMCLHLISSSGRYTHTDGKMHRRVPFGSYKIGLIASGEEHRFITNDVQNEPRVHDHEWAAELGLVSFAGYQIKIPDGKTLGVLALFAKHPISPYEDVLLDEFSLTIAHIIQETMREHRLSVSEHRYRRLFEAAKDGILILNAKTGAVIDANPFLLKMIGISIEKIKKQKIWHLGFFKNIIANKKYFIKLQQEKYVRYEDQPLENVNGESIDVEFISNVYLENKKNVIQCNIRNITERKRTEKALKKSEEMNKRIIESSNDCIKVLDLEGNLISMGIGGKKLLEIDDVTPYLNKSWIDFWKGKDRDLALKAISKAKKDDAGIFSAYRETAKGTPKWWEIIITPIKDENGKIEKLLAVSRDITFRKQSEDNRLESEFQHRKKIESANKKLAFSQKQLIDVNKDLQRALIKANEVSRLKTEFLAIMSHEIKTPLTSIMGFSELMKNDNTMQPNRIEDATIIFESSKRFLKILTDILEISCAEAGIIKINYTELSIKSLLDDIIILLKKEMDIKKIDFQMNLNNIESIYSDQQKLRQILFNIIGNAIKFTENGKISVEVKIDGSEYLFKIQDTGIGIAEQNLDLIFEIFRQVEQSNSRRYGGTGLGLGVCKKYVEALKGKIWVKSKIGFGSTFYFTVPFIEQLNRNNKSIKIDIAADSEKNKILNIFYVDDEELNRILVGKILKNYSSHIITLFDNGPAMLEELKKDTKCDLILLDLMMTGMNGKQCLIDIKKINSKIPVVALTGYTSSREDEINIIKLGFDNCISKPITIKSIIDNVNVYLAINKK